MAGSRVADDFTSIRARLLELKRDRKQVEQAINTITGREGVVRGASDGLRREWPDEELATAYLKRAGFELRRDRSWRPPAGRKHLTERERGAMLYLVRECGFDGLLTDAQHAERRRQLNL